MQVHHHVLRGQLDVYKRQTMMSVGARGMIGKGARLPEVVEAMKKYHGVYFGAIGGAGALPVSYTHLDVYKRQPCRP